MIYIVGFFLIIINLKNLHYQLTLFQQEHYQVNRYLIHFKKYFISSISTYFIYAITLLAIGFSFGHWYYGLIMIILSGGVINFIKPLVVKLKYTKRIKRFLLTYLLLLTILIILKHQILWISLLTLLTPMIIICLNYILLPLERKIAKHYLTKAQAKLTNYPGVIIGITGSFGKTSVKNYLEQLLKAQSTVLKSPQSYNTPLGLAKTINESLNYQDYLILEMGARYDDDIYELTRLFKPSIAIITEIGPQHLSTLKTIDNILVTKAKILASPNLKKIFLNYDNPYLRSLNISSSYQLITVAINHEATYNAKNIYLTGGAMTFDIYYLDEYLVSIRTPLLGIHNVFNLLLAAAVALEEKIAIDKVAYHLSKIKPVDHRLSIKEFKNYQIIDDSFNSNYQGFNNALDVLKLVTNHKVIITPGLVDLGNDTDIYNQRLAHKMTLICDQVYLIKNPHTNKIIETFTKNHYPHYQVYDTFKEAYQEVISKYHDLKVTILIENDLPDNFL